MSMLFRLLPYLGVALGPFMVLGGIGVAVQDHPDEPASLSIEEIASSDPHDLPEWIRVDDGVFLWEEAAHTYRERSDREDASDAANMDELYVPLVPGDFLSGLSDAPRTCVLVEFDRDAARERFPGYFVGDPDGVPSGMSVTFSPQSTLGVHKRILGDLRALGFEDFVVAVPGSTPLSAGEGIAMAGFGLLLALGCIVWIRRRRRNQAIAEALMEGAREGFRKGLSEGVRQGVQDGLASALRSDSRSGT